MIDKALDRVGRGGKTIEGKIIAVLLTLSLSLMAWTPFTIKTAFAGDGETDGTGSELVEQTDGDATVGEAGEAADGELAAGDPQGEGDEGALLGADAEGEAEGEGTEPMRAGEGEGATVEMVTVTFDPTTDSAEPLAPITIEVEKGTAISDQLPDVPGIAGYTTKWVKDGVTPEVEVTAATEVDEEFTAVVAKEKIVYTVTFLNEDGTTLTTRDVDIDSGFAISDDDYPAVPEKQNKVGRWVLQGTDTEFPVGTVVSQNTTVEPAYDQNIFTVDFMVDTVHYEQMTTAKGTTIVLPSDPVRAGATFKGWFTEPNGQGTQYTAESTVGKDLTLYAYFENQVRVSFIVKDAEGEIISEKSQYFVDLAQGDQITTLPDDPFMPGKVFDYWADPDGNPVEVGYTVDESFDAIAVFKDIETYVLTVHYFYMNGGNEVAIQDQVFDLIEADFPYTVTAPATAVADEITGDPIYYPSQPTITVTKADFGEETTLTVRDEYVAPDAAYKVGHYLKKLSGEGYELIETVDKVGVKNSRVTPDINNYAYATFADRDKNVLIEGDASQELKVYYDRKDFTLSYNVGEGDYIDAVTAPYGTEITLPTTATRAGYSFDGWYKDAACTEPAGSSYTLEENTTLYAKWNAAEVDYKIVYMIENANDNGYSYLATVTKQAATGSTITMTAQTAGAAGTRPSELDTTNFTFKDSTTATVAADGTTVVTVRYSRNVYTLLSRSSGYNASVTAKYGADITQAWTDQFNRHSGSWSYNNDNESKFKSLTIMPSLSVRTNTSPANTIYVYHHNDSSSYYQHLEYWLQNYTGAGVEQTTYNGKTYGRVKSIDMRYGYLSNTDDWYEITGYTKAGYTATHSRTQNGSYSSFSYYWGTSFGYYGRDYTYTRFNFYYDAADYPLTFYNYDGTLISSQDVTLGDDISSYLTSNVPEAPMEGATWLGWFTDQAHTSAYSGGTKMPTGLVLYGAFEFPTRTISYDSQGGSAVAPETDEYGFYASKPADPTKDHFTFQGWFTAADETGSPYDWNKPVTEDTKLYAHWTQDTIGYTVHYYEQGTTTKLLEDKHVSDPGFTEGEEITETAPTIASHVADKASVTKALSFNEEENTIIFYYSTIPNEITYTVNYVVQGTNIKVAKSKTETVPGTTTNVLEMAVDVDTDYFATQTSDPDILGKNYKPVNASQELQLALEGNVITFEYVSFTTSKITVNYFDMDGQPIETSDTSYVEKGDTFTVQNKAPEGYVYHHAINATTGEAAKATYQISGNEGDFTINIYYQKKLVIVANNKAKTYDGTALFSSFANAGDYTVTGNMRGDTLTLLEFDGSQTDAGTSATTPKNAQISKGSQALTDPETYYSIIYVPGSLTVKPVSVYISISADQWNTHSGGSGPNYYTGQAFNVGLTNPNKQHFNDNPGSAYVSITSSQRTMFKDKYGDAIWSALYGENGALISEKDAGTYTFSGEQQKALIAGVTVDGKSMMADPNYSITLNARDSFLTIEPLPLTISTPSDEKAYDGTPLTKEEGATLNHSYWTANIGGEWTAAPAAAPGSVTLGTDETITFSVTGSQTPVGSSENSYSIDWGENKSSNYRVNANLGTLEVTEATLKVTVNDKTVTYTGSEQEGRGFVETVTGTGATITTDDYKIEGLGEGDVLTIAYTPAKGTNAGTYTNGAFATEYTIVNAAGVDVTENYGTKTFTAGKLIINPKEITVTINGGSDSKVYNGENQTFAGSATPSCTDGLFDAEKFSYSGDTSVTGKEVNTYTTAIDIEKAAYADDNLKVTFVAGTPVTFSITKAKITITADDLSKVYGTPDPELTATVAGKPAKGVDPVYTVTRDRGENAGDYTVTVTADADANPNYEIVTEDGTFTIEPADVSERFEVTSPEDTVYNGSEQKQPVTVKDTLTGETLTEGKDFELTYTDAEGGDDLTNAGTKTVTITGMGNYKGAVAKTYDITAADVTVKIDDQEKDFDNDPSTDPELTYTVEGLQGQDTEDVLGIQVTREEGQNAGEYAITATTVDNPNYNVTVEPGKLNIKPVIFHLTFNPNGGTLFGSPDIYTMDVEVGTAEGTDVTIVEAAVRTGYKFLYWRGSEYQPGDTYTVTVETGDHAFTAEWEKDAPILPKTGDDRGTLAGLMGAASLLSLFALVVARRRMSEDDDVVA